MIEVEEIKKNLFDQPKDHLLVHCVSADWACGAGIAVEFDKRFDIKKAKDLDYHKWYGKGYCVFYTSKLKETKDQMICNLVTKEKYFMKPTYTALRHALEMMGQNLKKLYPGINQLPHISMPKIGCGLDGLNWEKVREIIEDVAGTYGLNITVCYL